MLCRVWAEYPQVFWVFRRFHLFDDNETTGLKRTGGYWVSYYIRGQIPVVRSTSTTGAPVAVVHLQEGITGPVY